MKRVELPGGLRASVPLALPTAAVGVSFGLLAAPLLGGWMAVAMSGVVWSGTAQFAALGTLASGGGSLPAVSTALLANTRFLPMGFALAPSMSGGWLRRVLCGALLADASFVIGARAGGRFDVASVVWAAPLQWLSWVGGTAAGVAGAGVVGDPTRWGLDVLFPVFYLSLLLPELFPARFSGNPQTDRAGRNARTRRPLLAAALAVLLTLALTPVAAPGVPVLAAAAAALIGLRRPPTARAVEA